MSEDFEPGYGIMRPADGGGNEPPEKQQQLPARKSPRADFHNYSGGNYFVTICTRDKEHYFGEICNDKMNYSEIGAFVDKTLTELASHYGYAEIPMFTVMPNHVHLIVSIREPVRRSGNLPSIRSALSVVIGGFKQAVTMFAKRNNVAFGWQPRYHDHIIRGRDDGNKIADYIMNNVVRWNLDCFNASR